MISYRDIPSGAVARAFATDASGNVFIVSSITTPTGLPQIHVDKTDSHGSVVARFDFGGTNLGIGASDSIAGAAVDQKGNLVIAGSTFSRDFPVVAPLIPKTGDRAAFITKLDAQLKAILFSTRLGGTQSGTFADALAVDKAGNIYVTGGTSDADFPVTPNAFQRVLPNLPSGSTTYAFLAEISSDNKTIVFSTYFGDSVTSCPAGGSGCATIHASTFGTSIALDGAGNPVIAGSTTATSLPGTAGTFSPNCGDCGYLAPAGFTAKLSADGSKLLWATYVPVVSASFPASFVRINGLTLDANGNVIVGGSTTKGLPVTAGALQTSFPGFTGFSAGFLMKLDSAAQRLFFSTYFGAELPYSLFGVHGVAVDSQGTVWITGVSRPEAIPISGGTAALGESYLAGLSPDGSRLAAMFTAPAGAAGVAVGLTSNGATALGLRGALLTSSPGQGPSLVGVGNSAETSVSNAVAPYELISLYGLGIGPQTPVGAQVAGNVVGNSLAGFQVLFDGIPAPLLFAGPTRIDAIVPGGVYTRDTTSLQIVSPSGMLNGPAMKLRASQPGVFLNSAAPFPSLIPVAAALNQDGSVNSVTNPAAVGSIVTVWATGTGLSSRAAADGTILDFPGGGPTLPVSVFTFPFLVLGVPGDSVPGPLSLEVLYAGAAAGMVAGVTQVNFRLPELGRIGNVGFSLQVGDARSDTFSVYLKPQQ